MNISSTQYILLEVLQYTVLFVKCGTVAKAGRLLFNNDTSMEWNLKGIEWYEGYR